VLFTAKIDGIIGRSLDGEALQPNCKKEEKMRRLTNNSANIRRVVFGVIVVCVLGTAANGTPWEGNGTAEQPYLIFDACDMQAIHGVKF